MKLKKTSIALNILNIIVLTALILGVLFAVFCVSILFGIFGQEVFNAVLLGLFKYSLIINLPNAFICIVTFISLIMVLCRKNVKSIKKVEIFMVLHIACAILSGLIVVAPFVIGLFDFIKNTMRGNMSGTDWDGLWIIVLFACLEGFSLMANIFAIKYLSNLQRSLDYDQQ